MASPELERLIFHEGKMNKLNKLEESVLNEMLSGNNFTVYKVQLKKIRDIKRKYSGVGFFTEFIFENPVEVDSANEKFQISDVYAEIPSLKHGAGFVLFVEKGQLKMLEGFTYDEPWPEDVNGFVLKRIP